MHRARLRRRANPQDGFFECRADDRLGTGSKTRRATGCVREQRSEKRRRNRRRTNQQFIPYREGVLAMKSIRLFRSIAAASAISAATLLALPHASAQQAWPSRSVTM